MTEIGLFEGQRYELMDRDLIDKRGQNPPHSFGIRLVAAWLVHVLGIELVQIQLPIEVAPEDQQRSLPEPDVAMLRVFKDEYRTRHPNGDELASIFEVADSSSLFELTGIQLMGSIARLRVWVIRSRCRRVLHPFLLLN